MNSNMLKMNKDKTEFIVFSSKQHVKKTDNLRIKVGSNYINSSMSVTNLLLILANTLGMKRRAILYVSPCIIKYKMQDVFVST